VPRAVLERWPPAKAAHLDPGADVPADLPIDHDVDAVAMRGGSVEARRVLRRFVDKRLGAYAEGRNQVEPEVVSGLSPYLHFGHVGAHEVFDALARKEGWHEDRLATVADGKRRGWWGMGESAEAFVDQLVTWRELGHVWCGLRPDDVRAYDALPEWALRTLAKHARDPRPHVYDLDGFERAATHDEIWNAAQRQLVREGRMHNYLRMLWGKKILEWSPSGGEALEVMIHLNDKYALDGRDPNSYSGITWCLGRFDRAWGPERPIFGTVRYMSSESTRRKIKLAAYLERYGPSPQGELW
jgi:deoxyribodipyrimidine photo-lyase